MNKQNEVYWDQRLVDESGKVLDYGFDLCEILSQHDDPYSWQAISEARHDFETRFGGNCYVAETAEHPSIRAIISYLKSREKKECPF
jgi:hypothetical protein